MRRHHPFHGVRSRTERAAAAVEFALVSLIFFPLLFGMIDYGLWFNDSLNARQGVREGARIGVVGTFTGYGCDTETGDMAKLKCITKKQVNGMSGPTFVKTMVPPSSTWAKGQPLLVCAMVRADGITGLVPLPGDYIRSSTRMSIESSTPLVGATSASDTLPAGADWSWCT